MRNLVCINLRIWGLIFTISSAFSVTSFGQPLYEEQGADRVIRLSLGHLFDPLTPGPHLSYEHRTRGNIYLRHEVGVFFDYNYPDQESLQDLGGFRLRTARRKYHNNPGIIRQRHYHEFAFDYRLLNARVEGDFIRGGFNGFTQRIPYGIVQHSFSLNYIRGFCAIFGEHWQLDLGLGVGLRLNNRNYEEVPEGAIFDTNGSLFWQYGAREPWHLTLSVPMILALGYQF
ncbi:MAG: hypothetical protein ACRBG0_13070 [Lewinella sp.]|uniref:hypothetical protein n=1 Tax=Lewinella sp. TaxID=2004506 RepID=UPI003D6B84D2